MKLILGSKSPRRKELLSSMGLSFELRLKETDESFPNDINLSEVPLYIANNKADALMDDLNEDELLLCADTVVIEGNEIIGKPKDREDAIEMLYRLQGTSHEVITGVVLRTINEQKSFSVSTIVTFVSIPKEEIIHYVDTFQPYDKAGSYGIQEWIGSIGILKIEGSYNNVVGLPTAEVHEALKTFQKNKPA